MIEMKKRGKKEGKERGRDELLRGDRRRLKGEGRVRGVGQVESNKADRHKSRAPSIQRRTDRQTDRQTDRLTEWLIDSRARDQKKNP